MRRGMTVLTSSVSLQNQLHYLLYIGDSQEGTQLAIEQQNQIAATLGASVKRLVWISQAS